MINRHQSKDEEDEVPELPPPILNYQTSSSTAMVVGDQVPSSPTARNLKARRKTNTTKELLGSLENLAATKSEFLNPNDLNPGLFQRGSRQTQSLRIPSAAKRR